MRTNIEIDDELMTQALAASDAKTKREVVEQGLRTLVHLANQAKILELHGKLDWDGDLDAMRTD